MYHKHKLCIITTDDIRNVTTAIDCISHQMHLFLIQLFTEPVAKKNGRFLLQEA